MKTTHDMDCILQPSPLFQQSAYTFEKAYSYSSLMTNFRDLAAIPSLCKILMHPRLDLAPARIEGIDLVLLLYERSPK